MCTRMMLPLVMVLVILIALKSVQAIPLDDTYRNGHWEDVEAHTYSAVHDALTNSRPSVRAAASYLGISQNIQAPELTNPARMPVCLSSSKVSKALTAAINGKYAGQLHMNASIDTTYVQLLTQCNYSSFITLAGPEEIKAELLNAANQNQLCDLLPKYCTDLNLSPTPVPSSAKAQKAATHSAQDITPTEDVASKPVDGRQHRGVHWRSSRVASTEPYLLLSSRGNSEPELPPVLQFKCIKHNFTQVLDHFASQKSPSDGTAGDGHPRYPRPASSRRLRQDEESDESEASGDTPEAQHMPVQLDKQGTFTQVYWVCDAAWPKERHEQKHSGHVIVFLGNESPLGIPKQPIVFENAQRLNALVVLVEHRYYGDSVPYPEPENERVPTKDYRWLSIEQVIEDTATVVQHVRKERDVPDKVPNIVIGGSYGGMIASYHRVVRPDVFDAAVAASAPIYYIVDTKMWQHTSNRYHEFIEDAANTMSGSTQCSSTIRAGLDRMLDLGNTAAGREEIWKTMNLCHNASYALPDRDAVEGLQNDVIGTFQGLAQVNNQPPVLGEMAIACDVVNNAAEAGTTPLAAIAALFTYMGSNGSSNWCYNFAFDPKFSILPDAPTGYNSYTYQCCTEATVYSSELPAKASDSTLNPEKIPVPVQEIEYNCRNIFGKHVPEVHGPRFARHIMPLLEKYGNVVFTNGDLDGWAGGSIGLLPAAERSQDDEGPDEVDPFPQPYDNLDNINGGLGKHSHAAFVVYRNASHCTDTHTNQWQAPNEPPEWKKQRALAMDYAVAFARRHKHTSKKTQAAF